MSTGSFVGVPAIYALEMAIQPIKDAFDCYGIYLVGSALEHANWRDIDVRMIMADEDFHALFPTADMRNGQYQRNPRWMLLTTALSERLRASSGLPIDFQIQPATDANERHKGRRDALGMQISKPV